MALEGIKLGQYRLQKIIGTGGMGEVYLAEDERIGQHVAIKVIRAEVSPYPNSDVAKEALRLFQREAKAIARLDHPRILPLYSYGEETVNGMTLTYLVMPYRSEGSFANWLQQRTNSTSILFSPQDTAYFISQAASSLQYAHDQQIIHQDIKPANFLVRTNPDTPNRPDLLLADFGLAKLTSNTSNVSHSVRGTPAYMAPEQWSGAPVPSTDQYALAILAYELLTGQQPFQGRQEQVMYQHLRVPPVPPSQLNPTLNKDIDSVLLHALDKDPNNRFKTIAAFANAFQQAVATFPKKDAHVILNNSTETETDHKRIPISRNPSPIPQPIPPRKQRPAVLALVALAVLIIISSIAYNVVTTNIHNGNATATAQSFGNDATNTAQAIGATSTVKVISTNNTAIARTDETSTANVTNNPPPTSGITPTTSSNPYDSSLGNQIISDSLSSNTSSNWDTNAFCAFNNGAYEARVSQLGTIQPCYAQNTSLSDFTYEVTFSIIAGDCGGIIVKADSTNYYDFIICENGQWQFYLVNSSSSSTFYPTSTFIHTGLGQTNTIAIVSVGGVLDAYINQHNVGSGAKVDTSIYNAVTIGVAAKSPRDSTTVDFTTTNVWT